MTILSDFGTSEWDRTAAAQQLAVVRCLWSDRQDLVGQLIGGEGSILRWRPDRDSWPPAWCLLRSGAQRYFIALAGTSNVGHAAGHVWGSFGRPYSPGVVVNGQWLDVWRAILADIGNAIPVTDPACRVYCSGFSYGGAVAQLASLDYAQTIGPERVQMLNFAAPKVLTEGYAGPLPRPCWRVRSSLDIVPSQPPSFSTWFMAPAALTDPAQFLSRVMGWQHYGTDCWLNAIGGSNPDQPPPVTLPPGVSVGEFAEHSSLNYASRLRAWRVRGGGGG